MITGIFGSPRPVPISVKVGGKGRWNSMNGCGDATKPIRDSKTMTNKLVVAYERVSSISQNLGRQTSGLDDIRKFDRRYQDKISGSIPFAERPAGKRLIGDIDKGLIGAIYFWEVSRIGRDVPDIHNTLQLFVRNQVQVYIHKEGIRLLNEDGSINQTAQLVLSVMAALSDIERQNIRERMMQGIALAKVQGKYIGRKKGTTESLEKFLNKPKSKKVISMMGENYPVKHISAVLGVSVNTIKKVYRALDEKKRIAI